MKKCNKSKALFKKKSRLTTERVSFGLQTTPEIETKVLRHQIVRGKILRELHSYMVS